MSLFRGIRRFGVIALLTAAEAGAALPSRIDTSTGPVQGFRQDGVGVFLGIPYAAPPLGALRWRPPRPVAPWTSTRLAWSVAAPCPQLSFGVAIGSEDCLGVNVWTPASSDDDRLPVLVWIHGGGDVNGSGDGGLSFLDGRLAYDGKHLAKEGAVVVSFNYRLGPFGFLAHPALTAEDAAHPSSGNYGHEDQVAALEWVRDNVAAFGGDPDNVTIFGESAGAFAVTVHLVSPASAGLFHRAIVQSGAADRLLTAEQAASQGTTFATALGCGGSADVPGCLRTKSAAQVLAALPLPIGVFFGGGAVWGPVVDGHVVPEQPIDAFLGGRFTRLPVLIGNTRHEGTTFVALTGANLSPAVYGDFLESFFGDGADAVRAVYPCSASDCSEFAPPRFLRSPADNAIAEVITNGLFVCPSRRVARALASHGAPVYFYLFEREVDSPYWSFEVGAGHAVELSFVFETAVLSRLTKKDEPLAEAMQDAWVAFARDGDPGRVAGTKWPRFRVGGKKAERRLALDLQVREDRRFAGFDCGLFDGLFFASAP